MEGNKKAPAQYTLASSVFLCWIPHKLRVHWVIHSLPPDLVTGTHQPPGDFEGKGGDSEVCAYQVCNASSPPQGPQVSANSRQESTQLAPTLGCTTTRDLHTHPPLLAHKEAHAPSIHLSSVGTRNNSTCSTSSAHHPPQPGPNFAAHYYWKKS